MAPKLSKEMKARLAANCDQLLAAQFRQGSGEAQNSQLAFRRSSSRASCRIQLRTTVRRKYGKDALASDGQIARALAAQSVLPVDLVHQEGLKEECFLDQINSELLQLVSVHNDTRRQVMESLELVATLTKDLKAEKAKIGSGLSPRKGMLTSTPLKLSARVELLLKRGEEDVTTIQLLKVDLARVEDAAAVAIRSVNDMPLHQSDLIIAELRTRFPDGD
ncbi:hypothetical protein JCGZ_12691 [Jatropha curcas]|uniref:Uncharacterized protein n=1 Tax=Jatropha curcas TaxID=180498 RepID=A0A067KQ31_JATCU|nr:hypothetical protein JCGZ_12691 [Jatropha curcas]